MALHQAAHFFLHQAAHFFFLPYSLVHNQYFTVQNFSRKVMPCTT